MGLTPTQDGLYEVMKEFNCKAVSIWSSRDDRREMAFTHTAWGGNWTDVTAGLHPGAKERYVRNVYTQRGQVAQYVGCCDTRRQMMSKAVLLSRRQRKDGQDGSRLMKFFFF